MHCLFRGTCLAPEFEFIQTKQFITPNRETEETHTHTHTHTRQSEKEPSTYFFAENNCGLSRPVTLNSSLSINPCIIKILGAFVVTLTQNHQINIY